MSLRVLGALMLVLGAGLAWLGIWNPLQQAQAGAPSISMYGGDKLLFLLPFSALLGVGYLLGGGHFHAAIQNGDPEKAKRWGRTSGTGWLLILISFSAAYGLHVWMKHALAGLGYLYAG